MHQRHSHEATEKFATGAVAGKTSPLGAASRSTASFPASRGLPPASLSDHAALLSEIDGSRMGVALPSLEASRVAAEEAAEAETRRLRAMVAGQRTATARSTDSRASNLRMKSVSGVVAAKPAMAGKTAAAKPVVGDSAAAAAQTLMPASNLEEAAPVATPSSFFSKAGAMALRLSEAKASGQMNAERGAKQPTTMTGFDVGTGAPMEQRDSFAPSVGDGTADFESAVASVPNAGSPIEDLSNVAREPDLRAFRGLDDSKAQPGMAEAIRNQPPAAVIEME